MDEDMEIWSRYIDCSRFTSYEEKGYRFGGSITTDGVSVSIPLHKKNYNEEDQKKKRKKQEVKNLSDSEMEALQEQRLALLKGRTIIGVDPGKYSIVYLTSDEVIQARGKRRMQISNVERRRAIGTKVFRFIQQKLKRKRKYPDWQALETSLSQVSSKATTVKGFQDYVIARFKVQGKLYEYYSNLLFRIHRWEKYKRDQRFQHHVVRQIGEKFGKDCVLAYGTWNRKTQMRGLIPSQTCGMRRLLSKHFTVVDTPEPNTTKTCSKCLEGTMEPCKKRHYSNPKKKEKYPDRELDVRGLRRCNNEKCKVFINRDYNAAINIRSNLVHRIHHGSWHPKFTKANEQKLTKEEQDRLDQLADEWARGAIHTSTSTQDAEAVTLLP
jgi:hypothetical protein